MGHPAFPSDPHGLGQGLHEDFDVEVSCAAGDVQRAEYLRLSGRKEGHAFERGLAHDGVLRAYAGGFRRDAGLLDG